MRLALVTYALKVGGVETFLRGMARHFSAAGHRVDVVETLRRGSGRGEFLRDGIAVVDAAARPWETRRGHAERLGRLLGGYDAAVLNDAPFAQAALGMMRAEAVAIPVLHLLHEGMARTAAANAENWDALVAYSPALERLALWAGVDAARVRCIPIGCAVPETWPRGGEAAAPEVMRLAYVGALEHGRKGVLDLAPILGAVRAAGVPCSLEIAGDGPDRQRLAALLAAAAPGAAVLHGSLDGPGVRALLGRADVLLFPSRVEGLGIVQIEAMAAGVVPVSSRLEGVTDFVVRDGETGFLVPAGDVAGFAARVVELAGDRGRLLALSQAAWRDARARFGFELTAQRYAALIEECRARRAAVGARRTGRLLPGLLGDYPGLPTALVRPARSVGRRLRIR